MKSKMKRRMLAIVLCMVIVLSNSSFIFASSESGTPAVEAASTEGTTSQTETDTQGTETTPQTLAVSESTPAPTDEPAAPTSVKATPTPTDTPEVTTTPEPTGTPTPEATPTPTDTPETTTTPEPTDTPEITTTPQPTDAPETTTTPEPTDTPEATPTPTQGPENGTSDTAQPTATPTPTEAPVKSNEAVELKQEFKDSDGNVTSTVKAQIPEGTFAADASEITMEVRTPDTASAEHVKEMMEELLPENHMLGDYIFYDIQFKANGTVTEPQKPITITFEGEELSVKDVKRANVFWLDPEDPQVDGDKDQLVEITQKSEMIENLQNSGQSTENIDDYDLSEITLKEDGISDKIQMEGRTSTIYGCYVEKEIVTEWNYEDDDVTITVSADESGIIPEDAELSVTPLVKTEITNDMTAEEKAEAEEINAQYDLTEQKLNEDTEKNNEITEGFLAYDISFLVNGEKVEPSGDVKVVMDFKEAAIPEGVSEDADVAVKHLKTDETAEDGVVIEDMAEKSTVQTNDNAEVEKVEFTTDSFSPYILNWVKQNARLTIVTQDMDGNLIGTENGPKLIYIGSNEQYKEKTVEECAPEIEDYTFYWAYVKGQEDQWGKVNRICYWTSENYNSETDQPFTLKTETAPTGASGDYRLKKTDVLYFVYSKDGERPQQVPTNSTNIDINMFNYNGSINESNSWNLAGNGFGFYTSTAGKDGGSSYTGRFTNSNEHSPAGNQGLLQEIVKKNLSGSSNVFGEGAMPVLNTNNGLVMSQLFTKSESTSVYTDLTGLFQIDEDGYYYYDSLQNAAVLNAGEKKVEVYDTALARDNGNLHYGNFFPFNSDWLANAQRGELYTYPNVGDLDLWFGMNVGMNFYQPSGGLVNGENMIFEFSGDDDVWVFIDGVLVLDLGGIHGRLNGTIDFATGDVDAAGRGTTLKECYREAYREKYPKASNDDVNEYLNSIFDSQEKFLDYSEHRLEFFYLERGGGAANCRLKFNMPSLPNDGITVSKLIDNYDQGAYTDVEFQFELYVDQNGDNEVTENEKVTSATKGFETYILREIGSTGEGEEIPFNTEGIFTLKHNQMATFSGIPIKTKYKVKEVGVSGSEYDQVTVSSGVTDVTGDVDLGVNNPDGYAETKILEVGSNLNAVFHNRCSVENMKQLYIEKELLGTQTSGDSYTVLVEIAGKPYDGEYLIGNSQSQGVRHETNNGKITFQADQVVTVLGNAYADNGTRGFPSGTSFRVTETDLDLQTYAEPKYEIKEGSAGDDPNTIGEASGEFVFDTNASVTVVNSLLATPDTPYIEVQKKFEGIDAGKLPKDFAIKLYRDEAGQVLVETLTLKDSDVTKSADGLTYTWRLIGEGTYYLKEEGTDATDYILDKIIVNGSEVSLDGSIEVTTKNPTFGLENDELVLIDSNKDTEFNFSTNNFIASTLTDGTIFVWTNEALSIGERKAIANLLVEKGGANFKKFTDISKGRFYSSLDKLEQGITIDKGTIYVVNGVLKFTHSSQWSYVIGGQYTRTNAVNAEIEITNSYIPKTVDIDLQKFGTNYQSPQDGATFTLYSGTKANDSITWQEKKPNIAVNNSETAHELKLENGYYKLEEIKAPTGFVKLDEPIYFMVQGQNVVLTDKDGNALSNDDSKPDMWQIVKSGSGVWTIQILNKALYDLPSAGSSGIFGYTMGGTLLLMAGTLILYKMKRKEVQES